MKIAIFTDAFYPKIDGVVTATISLAKGLANKNHKIFIIAPKVKLAKEFKYKNIEVLRTKSIPAGFYEGFRITSPLSQRILNHLKRSKVDIIHFQTPFTLGAKAIIVSHILKKPLVGTYHTMITEPQYLKHIKMNNKLGEKAAWSISKIYYERCDIITTPTDSIKQELKNHNFKTKIKTISNGIENIFDNRHSKQIKNKYNKNGKLLLFVGRISHDKNINFLLECFKEIHSKSKSTKLLIVGDGPQLNEVKNKIKELNLEKSVILTGKIPRDKLVKSGIYGACDIFVTTSKTETQGITLLEAQKNGLVCVALNEKGVKDVIKNNVTGYLTNSKQSFANAVLKLINNKSIYNTLKQNTLEEIKQHDMKKIISEWEKTYEELL